MTIQIDGKSVAVASCGRLTPAVGALGDLMFMRRKELGLSQEEMAGRIGVNAQTIANLERGRTKNLKKSENIKKLPAALEVAPEVVLPLAIRGWKPGDSGASVSIRLDPDSFVRLNELKGVLQLGAPEEVIAVFLALPLEVMQVAAREYKANRDREKLDE